MDQALQQLIDAVKQTAPELWRIGLLQAQVVAIQNAITAVACLLIVAIGFPVTHKMINAKVTWAESDEGPDRPGNSEWRIAWVLEIFYVLPASFCFYCLGPIIQVVVNPEYMALGELIKLVK